MLQYRGALQLYIPVRVGVGVELWAWTTLQPTILTPYKQKLPAAMAKQAMQHQKLLGKETKEGAVRKSLTIFCLPVKMLANVQNPCLPCSIHSKWTGGSIVDLSRAVQREKPEILYKTH